MLYITAVPSDEPIAARVPSLFICTDFTASLKRENSFTGLTLQPYMSMKQKTG